MTASFIASMILAHLERCASLGMCICVRMFWQLGPLKGYIIPKLSISFLFHFIQTYTSTSSRSFIYFFVFICQFLFFHLTSSICFIHVHFPLCACVSYDTRMCIRILYALVYKACDMRKAYLLFQWLVEWTNRIYYEEIHWAIQQKSATRKKNAKRSEEIARKTDKKPIHEGRIFIMYIILSMTTMWKKVFVATANPLPMYTHHQPTNMYKRTHNVKK